MAKTAFYAVRKGRTPGVYSTWDECLEQTKGFSGAEYKKFSDKNDAENYVSGNSAQKTDSTPKGAYAFIDGSFNADTQVYGYGGFVCADGKKYAVYGNGSDPEMAKMRNVAGEISGAMIAVRTAEELGLAELTILYDYEGIEKWATGAWKAKKTCTAQYASFMRSEDRRVSVKFRKVQAHAGTEGNETADAMAKKAAGIQLKPCEEKLLKGIL